MNVQVEPYQLHVLAGKFATGSQELRYRAKRLELIIIDLVSGQRNWKGQGAFSFRIKLEAMKNDMLESANVLDQASATLNRFAHRMETVMQLRARVNLLEQQLWACNGDSLDDLHRRQNLERQVAQVRQEAEWEANTADAQAAHEFTGLISLIPQLTELMNQNLEEQTGDTEWGDMPEPMRSYYARHGELYARDSQLDEASIGADRTDGTYLPDQDLPEGIQKELAHIQDLWNRTDDPESKKQLEEAADELRKIGMNDDEYEVYRVKAFIPLDQVTDPRHIPGTPIYDDAFHGDNRGFDVDNPNSRTEQYIVVNLNDKTVKSATYVGETYEYDSDGTQIASARAKSSDTQEKDSTDGESIQIHISEDQSIPLVQHAPGIQYDYDIDIATDGTSEITGAHTIFPSHEIYVQSNGGEYQPLHQFTPNLHTGILPPVAQLMYGKILKVNETYYKDKP